MNKQIESQKIYFSNLDGLRFLSFFLVFLTHSFSTIYPSIDYSRWYNNVLRRILTSGEIGVSFFFVLSGFLITFLLMNEKQITGKIAVKYFWIRRALRIWPLYYLIILFGIYLFPFLRQKLHLPVQTELNPLYCLTFLNNFYKMLYTDIPLFINVFWSIAVEEQFYFIWPLLFFFTPPKYYLYLITMVITISNGFRFLFSNSTFIEFHTLGVITDMAVGGLFAYFSITSDSFMKYMKTIPQWILLTLYSLLIIFICFDQLIFYTPFLFASKRLIMSLLFALIITEQNYSTTSLFKIEKNKLITTLGKYSYGLYCFHSISIMFCSTLFKKLNFPISGWILFITESLISLPLTILISWISYVYFESWFLKFKKKFNAY